MVLGIHGDRVPRLATWPPGLLSLLFRGRITDYTINRRQWRRAEDAR